MLNINIKTVLKKIITTCIVIILYNLNYQIVFAEITNLNADQILQIIQTQNTKGEKENDWAVYDIDKRANLIFPIKNLSNISFDYETNGYLKIAYSGIHPQIKIQPYLLLYKKIEGNGNIEFNILESPMWNPEGGAILMIEGTGILKIKNMFITYNEPNAINKYKWDVFLMPENIRHTTINFLTPIYWDITKNQYWNYIAGITFLFIGFVLLLLTKLKKIDKSYINFFIIISIIIYDIVFIYGLRNIYIDNLKGIWLTNEDKFRYYSMDRELGEILSYAKNIIKKDDDILVLKDDSDWFHPQNICFHLLPANCVYDVDKPSGIVNFYYAKKEDIDYIITFNTDKKVFDNFKPIFMVNKNVGIYKK